MNKKNHLTFAVLMLFLSVSVSLAQEAAVPGKVMSLHDCMAFAIANSTKIRIQQAEIGDAQIARRNAILKAFTPNVSGSTYAYYNFGRSIDPETNIYVTETSFHNGYSLGAGIALFDGFNAVNNLKISKTSLAIGRTQELLYFIREIKQRHLIPEEMRDFPVYVDSPLANEATAIFLQCDMDCLDDETRKVMREGENPIWFEGLHTVVSAEESKALNGNSRPKVIIASGGMCEGGRIRHHLKHNLWNEKNTILFVGYQAAGTLGRIIYDGAKTVKILGEPIESRAEVAMLSGISGHADREGLLNWLKQFEKKPAFVFVNHGDEDASTAFARTVTEELALPAFAPCAGSCYDLAKGEWIRLTEPVYRKKKRVKKAEPKKEKDPYTQLMAAVQKLSAYAGGMRDHANGELRELTDRILKLIKE